MNEQPPEAAGGSQARALQPLRSLTAGVATGVAAASSASLPGAAAGHLLLLALGAAAGGLALYGHRRRRLGWLLWLLAGLALGSGRGLQVQADELALQQRLAEVSNLALRMEGTVNEGWSRARWGWQTRLRVHRARHREELLVLPRTCRLEVRGQVSAVALPAPGSRVEALVTVRGSPDRPLLVASSAGLVRDVADPAGLPRLRQHLAQGLLVAAGTAVPRVRAAKLAATLVLGRRDLLPRSRRESWRRSGLAHMLAVSGLHVGLLAGSVWLLARLAGLRPNTGRLLVLLVLPTYALIAGAPPSALRAALMGMTYLAARLLGRALLPMAAVLLAACVLLLAQPALVTNAGFQLTVLVTAALVRWVPGVTAFLPGPRWLTAALAVPLVAQTAAAPVIAWHFRSLIPGAVLANLAVPFLVAPALLTAVAATLLAQLTSTGAAWLLELLALLERCLWLCGTPARIAELIPAAPPTLLVVLLAAAGWPALGVGRLSRLAAAAWLVLLAVGAGWGLLAGGPPAGVSLLPVDEGTAVLLPSSAGGVLSDAGRRHRQAAELLADAGVNELALVLASHSDEDHVGGLEQVLRCLRVRMLGLPAWMMTEPDTVPLLRAARRRRTRVVPLVRGSCLSLDGCRLEVLWPPLRRPPPDENDRSLVVRMHLPKGTVLLTADIGRSIETRLASTSGLGCDVLLAPHHGSRSSTSRTLLQASGPSVVLIPAGPANTHGHPHDDVLQRLRETAAPYRYPARDGWCGARPSRGRWRPYP